MGTSLMESNPRGTWKKRRSTTADLVILCAKASSDGEERGVGFMEKFGVYEDATIEECFAETGRAPVGTKWVDVNKGTAENPNIRCRLVARDFKPKGEKDRADLFASMPPLEAKKVLFSIAAWKSTGTCSRWLYGMRQAASAWERDFVEKLAEIGMVSGKSSPVVFHDPMETISHSWGWRPSCNR